jgi:DNA-binding transcriptional LysR family regulator
MIETSWLRAFASFAEDANLSRAARRLHLTQPAVHAQLRRLSEAVGAPLYVRRGRALALTREGEEVAAFARDFAESTAALLARVRGLEAARRLVLAAGAGAILYVIDEGLRAFARAARGATVEITGADAPAAVEAVTRGAAHVGVAVLDEAPAGLLVHRLTDVAQVLVMPRSHRLAGRRTVSVAALAGERLVLPPEGRPQRAVIDAALRAAGVRCTLGAVARGWDLSLKLAELGAGLAVVNACCALPRGLLARPLRELPAVRYVAFTRPGARADAAELIATLVKHGDAWRARARPLRARRR